MIHKFEDLNGNGRYDPGEPPLVGIRFDVIVGAKLYAVSTDENGEISLCFEGPVHAFVDELVREAGGQWSPTTPLPVELDLGCGTSHLWVGNRRTKVPSTGLGGQTSAPKDRLLCGIEEGAPLGPEGARLGLERGALGPEGAAHLEGGTHLEGAGQRFHGVQREAHRAGGASRRVGVLAAW